jgi:hypothetical protein
MALTTTAQGLNGRALLLVQLMLERNPLNKTRSEIHPDVAVLDLGGQFHKINLFDTSARSPAATQNERNWDALEWILRDVSDICATHKITPVVVYIPSASQVYAPFSTPSSGGNWLRHRAQEIAVPKETEAAVARLVAAAGIDFISLSNAFQSAANEGELLYYPLDPHWNSRGQELAATLVADVLKTRFGPFIAADK